jgi:hypothetical protein
LELLADAIEMCPPPVADVRIGSGQVALVVHGVNDHENLGALYRNAAALGAAAVVLDPQSRLVPGAGGLGAAGAQSRCGADEGVSGLDGFSGPTGCCALGLDCGDALACAD